MDAMFRPTGNAVPSPAVPSPAGPSPAVPAPVSTTPIAHDADVPDGVRAWQQASAQVISALLVTGPIPAIDLVVEAVRGLVGCDHAWVEWHAPHDTVILDAYSGSAAGSSGRVLRLTEASLLREVGRTRQPLVIDDPRTSRIIHGSGRPVRPDAGPLLMVPLVEDGTCIGALGLANSQHGARFSALDVEVAQTFGGYAVLAHQVGRAGPERHRLAVLESRDALTRNLPDSVIERLLATGAHLERLQPVIAPAYAVKLEQAVQELHQTVAAIRAVIGTLPVTADGRIDVAGELLRVRNEAAELLQFEPRMRLVGDVDGGIAAQIGPPLVLALTEAFSNVAKHAYASRVEVELHVDSKRVHLDVLDDGVGAPASNRHESGLARVRRTATDLGGRVRLGAGEGGRGTLFSWSVPNIDPLD
jgi:signal transduction histidine kinase